MTYRMLVVSLAFLQVSQVFAGEEVIRAEVDWMAELVKGGNTSLALVALFMASVYFVVERMLALRNKYIVPKGLAEKVEPLWHKGEFETILALCKKSPSTFSRMIEYLTHHRIADPGLLIPGAQDIASRELRTHGQKTFSLAVVASLAPLLGLLGTMIGMIESFKLVEVYGDDGGASMLAGSISKALITTAVGLIIAIPALALYHWFKFRINGLAETLEERLEFLVNSWLLRGGLGQAEVAARKLVPAEENQSPRADEAALSDLSKSISPDADKLTTKPPPLAPQLMEEQAEDSEIIFNCVGCGIALSASRKYVGQSARCMQCDTKQLVPDSQ
jgi:biopolymer transport protein ExbB/TolQ